MQFEADFREDAPAGLTIIDATEAVCESRELSRDVAGFLDRPTRHPEPEHRGPARKAFARRSPSERTELAP